MVMCNTSSALANVYNLDSQTGDTIYILQKLNNDIKDKIL